MKKVQIYIKPTCGFCKKALLVLKRAGIVQPDIVDISKVPARKQEMITRAGGKSTVPQIFVDNKYLGDCSKVVELEKSGKLKELVS